MKRTGFKICKNLASLSSIMLVLIVLLQFLGCASPNIIKATKAPQGTYECLRGYSRTTCPECSGSGQLQVAPWEQRSQEKASGTKGSLLGTLSFFSKHESPSSGYKECWRCGGRGVVCERDESAASAASSPRVSYEERAVRDNVYMAASYRNFVLIDKLDRLDGDVFYVAAVPRPGESGPAKIPGDAIENALTEFTGLRKDYMFFHRFASAIKEGLALKGQCLVECIYEGAPLEMRFIYRPRKKHLEILVGGESYGIDLRKVDVSVDKVTDKDPAMVNTRKAMPDSKLSKKTAIQTALQYRKEGNIEQGIAYLNDVLKRIPDDPELLLCLGVFYEEKKEFEKAEIALKRGLGRDPNNIRLHFLLGDVYYRWGRKEAAIEELRTVIQIDPRNTAALNHLGYLYAESGENLDEAERLIKEALKQDPDNGAIIDSLGWVYFKKGLFTEALKYLEKAARLVPDDPSILEHLGDVHRKRGDNEEALSCYKRSLLKKNTDKADLEAKIRELTGK